MKKIFLALMLTGFVSAGAINTAYACEDGKCKMEHKDKKGKKYKSAESCHMTAKAGKDEKGKTATASCCMKKDATKAEASKTTKETKAQK